MTNTIRKVTAAVCIFMLLSGFAVNARAGDPAADLKQIEYTYYFRGKYAESIGALTTFLARVDVKGAVAVRANEFLAASHVLGGSPPAGRDVFATLIASDPAYPGPDAAVFKPEVIDVYAQARAEYAANTIKAPAVTTTDVPAPAAAPAPTGSAASPTTTTTVSKPIYKKWWFYAGAAAVIGGVAAMAGGGGGSGAPPAATGTVSVGVTVH
jgi:hypothetical protein